MCRWTTPSIPTLWIKFSFSTILWFNLSNSQRPAPSNLYNDLYFYYLEPFDFLRRVVSLKSWLEYKFLFKVFGHFGRWRKCLAAKSIQLICVKKAEEKLANKELRSIVYSSRVSQCFLPAMVRLWRRSHQKRIWYWIIIPAWRTLNEESRISYTTLISTACKQWRHMQKIQEILVDQNDLSVDIRITRA